jgi:hypothetical protein
MKTLDELNHLRAAEPAIDADARAESGPEPSPPTAGTAASSSGHDHDMSVFKEDPRAPRSLRSLPRTS